MPMDDAMAQGQARPSEPQAPGQGQPRSAAPEPAKADKPGRRWGVLVKSLAGVAAIFLADVAGTIVAMIFGLPERPTIICGYLFAAIVGICMMRALGAPEVLRPSRHALSFAFDKCGWLLAVNLVLGLLTLMPDDGERLVLAHGWPQTVLYVLIECAFIGITEECAFRGLLLGGIVSRTGSTKKGVIAGALLSAALFGLAHVVGSGDLSPLGILQACLKIVQAGIVGAAFAAVALSSRSISGTAAVHALFDFLVMAPSAALGADVDHTEYVATGAEGVASAVSYLWMIVIYLPVVYLTWEMLRDLPAPDHGWFCLADGTPRAGRKAPAAPPSPLPADARAASGVAAPAARQGAPKPPSPIIVGPAAPTVAGASGPEAPHAGSGAFITLEGIDGSGKTTQADLLEARLRAMGREVVRLREPGGTAISEKVRALLLDPANAGMSDECELLLYEASRAQLVREAIEPALARGAVVLCDRFADSTWAYQHGGRRLDGALVRNANALGTCGVAPTRTIVLDLDPEVAFARATKDGADRLEAEGLRFQERVRASYLRLALDEPARVRVVDAQGDAQEVAGRVFEALRDVVDGANHA